MKKSIFDEIAISYHEMRPRYTSGLFDSIIVNTGVKQDDKILEIGAGTGQATEFFIKQGYNITVIELGQILTSFLENEFRGYPNLKIINSAFEEVSLPLAHYDLIFAATSFHWIQKEYKFKKPYELLKPNGHLAIIETKHLLNEDSIGFFNESQFLYKKYRGESMDTFTLNGIADIIPIEFDETLFKQMHFQVFPLKLKYSADEYVRLLSTYSDVILMEEPKRIAFLNDMKTLIKDRFNNSVCKYYGLSLTIARKK